jgi:3-deoxy-manno-octulosonate cytidylyltransferase (CMP-KDO synthetase)
MHTVAIIPARYASTRLPAKPLHLVAGQTLIQRVYTSVFQTKLFQKVIIATDHQGIFQHAQSFGADAMMTSIEHISGTDRIAECAENIDTDLIVNVQGDEPFITREPLEKLIKAFFDPVVNCASLMHCFENYRDVHNPNHVKVIVDNLSNAIYFSRSVIPYDRDGGATDTQFPTTRYYKHIGVYAFRPKMLQMFVGLPAGKLEQIERLEQLRLIENGYQIRMIQTDYQPIGIDTIDDVAIAEKRLLDFPQNSHLKEEN